MVKGRANSRGWLLMRMETGDLGHGIFEP